MKITPSFPVKTMSGHTAGSQVVFFARKDSTFARAYSVPANPNTDDQVTVRNIMSATSKAWATLSDAQREDWQTFANTYYGATVNGVFDAMEGFNCFAKCNNTRQYLGLAVIKDAPLVGPPVPITAATKEQGDEIATSYTWSGITPTDLRGSAEYKVIVEITNAMTSLARTPRASELRWACGVKAASAQAVDATGIVAITDARIAVANGERFGWQLTVVRLADGQCSQPFSGDDIRSTI